MVSSTICCRLVCDFGSLVVHRRLARPGQTPGDSFRFTSMALGAGRAPVTYSNVLFIDLSPEGIGISILLPFRIFHPRLLIPWMAVDECRPEKFWLMTNTAVYLSEPKTRLLFARRVGERVDEYWKRYRLLHGVD